MINTQRKSTRFPKPIVIITKSLLKTNFSPIKLFIIVGIIKGKKITKRIPVTNPYFKTTNNVAKVVNSIPGIIFTLPKKHFSNITIREAKIITGPPTK